MMVQRQEFKDKYVVEVGPYGLSKDGHHIVYWEETSPNDHHCFSLARFVRHNEGYELQFVGDRPFAYSWSQDCSFMEFAAACQKYLDGVFSLEALKGR
jgi:hypothetical protein